MSKKIFLDTNIVIDMIDEARLFHTQAKETLFKLIEEEYEVYISEDMISTIYYILKSNRKVLFFFQKAIENWNIVPFGKEVVSQSISFTLENNTDLEDTLQCFCARYNGCDIFLTSDRRFVDCGIKSIDYRDFL